MPVERWNSGRSIATGSALLISMALVTGVVVANWNGKHAPKQATTVSRDPVQQGARVPPALDIAACNQYAGSLAATTPQDVLEKAVIGGALGAGVGAASGAIAGGGRGAGKGAAIGGIVGATAGTLYGLNEVNQSDARAVAAYRACMKERGHMS